MNKAETLAALRRLSAAGEITKREALEAFSGRSAPMQFSQVLYMVGALIVIIGIIVLIAQNWDDLDSWARIAVTLGFSIAAQITAVLLAQRNHAAKISSAFFAVGGALLPLGLAVTLNEADYDLSLRFTQTMMAGISLATYTALLALFMRPVVLVFTVAFGTWFFFAITTQLVFGRPYFDAIHFTEYRVLAVGVTYMLLAYALTSSGLRYLSHSLYFLGSAAGLAAAFSLGGFKPDQNMFWELVFPLLCFGLMYVGVYVKSRGLLVVSSLALMAYIIKLTIEYFSDSLGWPLALVVAGLALIGVGYGMVGLSRKIKSV